MKKFLLSLAAVGALTAPLQAAVVINEFSYDDPSTDDEEFIELYNNGSSAVDISNYGVDMINGNGGVSYGVIGIPAGTTLASHDYYLIVFSSTAVAKRPASVDLVTTYTSVQNGNPDGIVLRDAATSAVLDAVSYGTNSAGMPAYAVEGAGIYGLWAGTGIERSASTFDYSIGRVSDGADTNDNIRDFCKFAASPGTSNNTPPFAHSLPYTNDFNSTAGVATYPEFWGRFVDPHCEDPTTNTLGQTPGASPGGGNACIFSDTSGGGDTYHYDSAAYKDWTFEAYVYLNSAVQATYLDWEIGIGGCTDESFNFRSVPANYGSRGVFWRYSADATSVSLQLVERFSSIDRNIGAPITISSGSNDGWQRLYISRTGTNIKAIVGGTLGNVNDGTQRTDSSGVSAAGAFFAGFRENITVNNSWLWMDNLSLTAANPVSGVNDWSIY